MDDIYSLTTHQMWLILLLALALGLVMAQASLTDLTNGVMITFASEHEIVTPRRDCVLMNIQMSCSHVNP